MEDLIIQHKYLDISELYPHEEVLLERKKSLTKYLKTNYEEIIIPSILVCSKSNMIIDGHHRYFTLMEFGCKKIPVTLIDYFDERIITHSELKLSIPKKELIDLCQQNILRPPKSSIHRIKTSEAKSLPIILLSKLSLIQ